MPDNSLLGAIETWLLAKLAPLITEAGVGDESNFRQVTTEAFDSDDLDTLLEQYKSRMPGAFLSIPDVAFVDADFRVVNLALTYRLLLGYTRRADTATNKVLVYNAFQNLCEVFCNQRGGAVGACVINFPKPVSFVTRSLEGGGLASLLTVQVEVRNWAVNQPEK